VLWRYRRLIGRPRYGMVWRLRGLIRFLRGRTDWGSMTRRGFAPDPAAPVSGGRERPASP
jgi:hypothetical protein